MRDTPHTFEQMTRRIAELEREANDCRQIITTYAEETEAQLKRIAELESTLLINQQYYTEQLNRFLTPLRQRIAELEGLLSGAKCPNCDGSGIYADGRGEPVQCRWCYERDAMKGGAK